MGAQDVVVVRGKVVVECPGGANQEACVSCCRHNLFAWTNLRVRIWMESCQETSWNRDDSPREIELKKTLTPNIPSASLSTTSQAVMLDRISSRFR